SIFQAVGLLRWESSNALGTRPPLAELLEYSGRLAIPQRQKSNHSRPNRWRRWSVRQSISTRRPDRHRSTSAAPTTELLTVRQHLEDLCRAALGLGLRSPPGPLP